MGIINVRILDDIIIKHVKHDMTRSDVLPAAFIDSQIDACGSTSVRKIFFRYFTRGPTVKNIFRTEGILF